MSNVQNLHITFNQEDDLGVLSVWDHCQPARVELRPLSKKGACGKNYCPREIKLDSFTVNAARPDLLENYITVAAH